MKVYVGFLLTEHIVDFTNCDASLINALTKRIYRQASTLPISHKNDIQMKVSKLLDSNRI